MAAGSKRWTGTSGGLHVTITQGDVVAADAKGARLFSLRELFPNVESDDPNVDTYSASYRPLSLVGPYLSLERDGGASAPGAAHAQPDRGFVTLDLRKPERSVPLTRFFTEQQVLSAFRKDGFLATLKVPLAGVDSLKALTDAFAKLNDCHVELGEGHFESFAFHSLNGDGLVAVRFGLQNTCLTDPEIRQLGLLLPVPPTLESDLKAAAERRHGFLMKDSKRVFGSEFWISFKEPRMAPSR
jgi:hypothetical protein